MHSAHPVTYRNATPEDLDWLLELRMETMGPHYAAAQRNLTVEQQKARLLQDFDAIRIIRAQGREVGMVKVVRNPASWKLVQIQLVPDHQGRGLGGEIVRELIAEAQAHNVPLQLEVLKVNPARRLYHRLGFRVVDENDHSYMMAIEP